MKVLRGLEKAFVKDIMEVFPEPKPHYNTLSTMVRNLEEKGYVGHEAFGKTHRYFPIVSKEAYRTNFMQGAMKDFFNKSYESMVSHFAKEEKSVSIQKIEKMSFEKTAITSSTLVNTPLIFPDCEGQPTSQLRE